MDGNAAFKPQQRETRWRQTLRLFRTYAGLSVTRGTSIKLTRSPARFTKVSCRKRDTGEKVEIVRTTQEAENLSPYGSFFTACRWQSYLTPVFGRDVGHVVPASLMDRQSGSGGAAGHANDRLKGTSRNGSEVHVSSRDAKPEFLSPF